MLRIEKIIIHKIYYLKFQFKPVTIENDEDYSGPSSKSVINVSVATYHGLILKEDQFTFFISFKNPDNFDEAELRLSTCELLNRLGMISHKKSLITVFGHKHFRQKFHHNFDIFHEKISTAFVFGLNLEPNC